MKRKDFIAIISNVIADELKDDVILSYDYDLNTRGWISIGENIALKAWPTLKAILAKEAA